MKIAVTGASGLIGRALVPGPARRRARGARLVRRTPRTADEHRWDPQHHRIDPALLADVDAVINLAGEPIRPRPWTSGYKQRLLRSRVDATTTISEALAAAAAADPGRAARPAVGFGRRLLRRHRRRAGHRGDPAGQRLPGRDVRPVGGGHRRGRGGRRPGGAPADRAGARREALLVRVLGWSSGSAWAGASARPPVLAVDQPAPTRSARSGTCSPPTCGPGQPHRPRAGDERRVHPRARPRAAPARPSLPVPGFALNLALGDFGRSSVVGGQRALPAGCRSPGTCSRTPTWPPRCGPRSADPRRPQPIRSALSMRQRSSVRTSTIALRAARGGPAQGGNAGHPPPRPRNRAGGRPGRDEPGRGAARRRSTPSTTGAKPRSTSPARREPRARSRGRRRATGWPET